MGISIWSKANPTIKTSMGYMRFGNIRIDIAKAYNYEIGLINESYYNTFNQDDRTELEKRFESIYKIADRKTKTLMNFLCKKDTGDSASKNMCKLILELKEKVIDLNKEYEEYIQTYLIPFFRVIEDGCNKGIEWC